MVDVAAMTTWPAALAHITPAAPIVLGGLLAGATPILPLRKLITVLAPVLALVLWGMGETSGVLGQLTIGPFVLDFYRYDGLSRIFGLVFIIAAVLNAIYGWHDRDRAHDAASMIYAGAAVGGVFAGDLLTLFIFWELTALASVYLVMARGGRENINAGLRYLSIQVLSGVLLLAGAVAWASTSGGSWAFGYAIDDPAFFDGPYFDPTSVGGALILIGFGVKAAFPLLHNWLQDAYPRATPAGAVVLSAFTTKLAIYALARGFAGWDALIYVGAIMAVFPIFFALAEDDLRRTLAYSLNSQLGFMVCGVGLGTELALNGAAAHAFVSVLYKALLFMAMGAVLLRTDTVRASQLGGLYRTMPFTALCCVIGGAAISAVPLFSGFAAKGMVMSSLLYADHAVVWVTLMVAAVAALIHTGIKVPYFAFFGVDRQRRPTEAPFGMLLAMGGAAFLCVYLALPLPQGWGGMSAFFTLMPFADAQYDVYDARGEHVITQLQVLLAGAFVFAMALRFKLYPRPKLGLMLDTDWFYRRPGFDFVMWISAVTGRLWAWGMGGVGWSMRQMGARVYAVFAPAGALNRVLPDGASAIWTGVLLALALAAALFFTA